jgi:hypothetical protein
MQATFPEVKALISANPDYANDLDYSIASHSTSNALVWEVSVHRELGRGRCFKNTAVKRDKHCIYKYDAEADQPRPKPARKKGLKGVPLQAGPSMQPPGQVAPRQ